MIRSSLIPFLGLALVAACGGRSSLVEASSSGEDAGPADAGGPSCDPGAPATPILTVSSYAYGNDAPSLAPLADGRAALAMTWLFDPAPAAPPTLVLTQLDPWSAWPPEMPAPVAAYDTSGIHQTAFRTLAAPSRVGGPEPAVALAWSTSFARRVAMDGALDPILGSGIAELVADAQTTAHLVASTGASTGATTLSHLDLAIASDEGWSGLGTLACVKSIWLPVDAIASGGGWLLAAAVGTPFGPKAACESLGEEITLPVTLRLLRVSTSAALTDPGTAISLDTPAMRLRMAPRSDGAWVAWSTNGFPKPKIEVARFDANDAAALAPTDVPTDGDVYPETLAVAPLGDDLAIAVVIHRNDGTDAVVIQRLDAQGHAVWSRALDLAGPTVDPYLAWNADLGPPPVALLPSPQEDALLVAWAEYHQDLYATQVRVARLDCVGGP